MQIIFQTFKWHYLVNISHFMEIDIYLKKIYNYDKYKAYIGELNQYYYAEA